MDYAAARKHMVDSQILPNRVTDERVVEAMSRIPREVFVPERAKGFAYVDEAIDIGNGRYLMEPMLVARLLQAADTRSSDVALAIGCGTGYAAAILGRLVDTVVVVESDADLAARAGETLSDLGIDNVAIMNGPLAEGWPKQAPYDVIYVDGAVPEVPDAIQGQLGEGGRLVAIIGGTTPGVTGKGTLFTRYHGVISRLQVFDGGTPPLPGFEPKRQFTF